MHYLDFFSQSNHSFAIKWDSSDCVVVRETSKNIVTFIAEKSLRQIDFSQLIFEQSDREARKAFVKNLNKQKNTQLQYSLKGLNNKTLYVFEEVIVDNNKAYMSIFTDMTHLQSKNEKLEETSERLELVLEGTRLGMWDWNPQTNEVTFDDRWAEMLGLSLSELSQTLSDWQDRVHPDDLESCFYDIGRHLDGTVAFYENTHRMKHKDGSWRHILDRGRVVKRDEKGQAIRFTGTHTDVTALKKAEEEARAALQSRNKFFARMSHEIRTPLHGILGTADILARKNLSQEQDHLVNIINESGESLQVLLNDILDIARIEEGVLAISAEEANILPTLMRAYKLFGQKANTKALSYQFHNHTHLDKVIVKTDLNRLHQIFCNVISNAIKFTQSGFVKVEVDIHDSNLMISISDSGIGIEDTSVIFNAYEQEGTSESKQKGSGLGLSIVKSLCESLSIPIRCESSKAKGSTFVFNLGKVLDSNKETELNANKPKALHSIPRRKKALVVDDHEINLYIAQTLLNDFFEHVDIASTGEQAVEMVAAHQDYDFVFMDMNMPGMNGVEATDLINDLNLKKRPLIVAQTADTTEETMLLFSKSNVEKIITKPFTSDKLLSLFQTLQAEAS